MGLAEAFEETEQEDAEKKACVFVKRTAHFSDNDKVILQQRMDDPKVGPEAIARALGRVDVAMTVKAIANHRKLTCACRLLVKED